MVYEVRFTKEAQKDIAKLTPKLQQKLKTIIQDKISIGPDTGKKLLGDLTGFFFVRLSYKDRIIYTLDEDQQIIYIHRGKTHSKE